ncbi:MAG: Asp-tRNA(Asn)/Glu-tRNA(Gln) amidotransferase subunit GatB [Acidobacteriota bacterium]|nr:Asp-tRNA(Asn)/Glu-tRNA(Gln) amidotransferase subunit GatB [Acidobacteriota bacterium]
MSDTGDPQGVSNTFEAVIGLEIHAQLMTATKIFCGCSTAFGAAPNAHTCPVCAGLPGALPVLNRRAVDLAVTAALALGCEVQERSVFARKNYFYPDLPKGYQISQYEQPLATGGGLQLPRLRQGSGEAGSMGGKFVKLTRIHMEEDAGKSLHEGFADSDRKTYLDYNRSGVPLVEIVTEPDLRSAEEAAVFFETLRQILVWLGVNDGNMDEGSLRCDANVSVRRRGETKLGTKTEVKNVNSFRYLEKAIHYEIGRHIDVIDHGGRIVQETRLFDAAQGKTYSMRSKEEAHDYRYFPEPDLPPLVVDAERRQVIARTLPELPEARRRRFIEQYAIPEYDAALLTQTRGVAEYFEETARVSGNAKASSNWVMGEILRAMKDNGVAIEAVPITPAALAGLIAIVDRGTISSTVAKEVFATMYETGREAGDIVTAGGLAQISDSSSLEPIVHKVVAAHPDVVAEIRAGKDRKFQFLVGQVMKETKGKGDPKIVTDLLHAVIGG